ncbi:MAG: S8 family serine peptidase [Bdellovibrionales bacterium]|nr:S8 family serine peptidase [Bdellovibrionales bacterium]NQZ18186.1 S8 family serine peptidase [Bdellovibrionales bacterium]
MDVYQKVLIVLLSFILINCKDNSTSGGTTVNRPTDVTTCQANEIPGEYLVKWEDGSISVEYFENDEDFTQNFLDQHVGEIAYAEPHYRLYMHEGEQVQIRDWGGEANWGVDSIEASSAWLKNNQGEDVIVAVIDSGLDINHPELQNTLAVNELEEMNGVDDDGNGLIDDRYGYDFTAGSGEVVDNTGHGTHVAGVIVAQHGVGSIVGVAPNVKVLPLNFISSGGSGDVSGALNAIRYSAYRGAKVINASWGGRGCSTPLREEIQALAQSNILFVTAAGNSGNNISNLPEYPAAFALNNQITVGASTFDNKTAGFSNYGELVDVMAPGAFIVSTYPYEYDLYDDAQDGLAALNGTSMAAPFVAATAALLWSANPDATYVEIKQAILNGVNTGPFPVKTRGVINVRKALDAMNP